MRGCGAGRPRQPAPPTTGDAGDGRVKTHSTARHASSARAPLPLWTGACRMRRRTTYSTAVVVAVFALCTATPRTAAQTHKTEHRDWRLTCGEGGEKDPKKPNWTPPTWVYLNCGQYNIGDVVFASWGTPEGSCSGAVGTSDSFHKGTCDSKASVEKVKTLCVGKPKCKIPAGPAGAADGSGGNDFFGAAFCTGPDCVWSLCAKLSPIL